ncbi:MAG: translation initiation factor IF-2 [Candidatus Melainabacteria bacterium]|nr:MAG: translation initiation factor IF-2 [Candidatus Melainabacteria bacterium]
MDDRVRIYELARRMNIPNQDIITALRELGYDIKTHSSTVDSNAVGLLITALGKKKQEKVKSTTKQAGKTVAKPVAPPQPVAVKPRVLSRYRPAAATTDAAGVETVAAATAYPVGAAGLPSSHHVVTSHSHSLAPAVSTQVIEPPHAAPPSPPATTPPAAPSHAAPATEHTQTALKSSNLTQEEITEPSRPARAAKGQKPAAPTEEPASPVKSKPPAPEQAARTAAAPQEHAVPETEPEVSEPEAPAEEDDRLSLDSVKFTPPIRPMTPSVPIRIAAPSVRATPPRPPKTHRQTPAERHIQKKEEKVRPAETSVEVPKVITLTNALTITELAEKMGVSVEEVIKRFFMKGIGRTVNQLVELELAKELAAEMEYEVSTEPIAPELVEVDDDVVLSEEDKAALVQRPPVVTIMGHVDHGKTSLLDAIRQTKFLLTDAEAGGITQHIGAYHVEVPYEEGTRQIVFLDTPGHEAFTAMRARGAKATDIAILVVAADDGVMPQTVEAIDHVKAAGVPIIVAVNKVDKPGADPTRVMTQLMEYGLVPEEYGGNTVCVNVSAKKRTNLDLLLEMILTVAELEDLSANPEKPAEGVIIEAELSRGRGAVATALVENGTLREGDFIVAGSKSGRVRALFDDRGQRVKAAGPSMPVEVLGLDEVPLAGERFEVVEDSAAVRTLVEKRKSLAGDRRPYHVTLESLHDMLTTGEMQELNVIIKADVQGTAEAIADSVRRLSGSEVQVRVLRTASGDISENDVNLAASSNAIIIGFNVQPDQNASRVSEAAGVDIRTYSIIYQITDDLLKAIQGLIQPVKTEVQIGSAEVRQVFKFGKNLNIAGCMVTSGKVTRGAIARIERNGQLIYEGKVETLKRFKDDAKEVAQGFECGMSFEKFNDLQEGDVVNAFVIQETKKDLARA